MNEKPAHAGIRRRIVLLTGMSGAGLLTALKSFEDIGYEAVDNLRLGLIPALLKDIHPNGRPLAVTIDTRNSSFSVDDLVQLADDFRNNPELDAQLLFLECSDEALQQRFTETRRRHPLADDLPVTDGIRREREMMWSVKDNADQVIDTSLLSIHDLRRLIMWHYQMDKTSGLTLVITSFSYRHGLPREADLVFDARFLKNPHWEMPLRCQSGQDEAVADYIRSDPDFGSFMTHLTSLLGPLLPRYQQEGKSYLTIAIGCTGGRHRSVFVAEQLATNLALQGYVVGVAHRDVGRPPQKG